MEPFQQASEDYQKIEKVLLFLENNFKQQPSLSQIAKNAGLSEFHFQKMFSRWVGISPKRFLQYLTKEYAKNQLLSSGNLLDATFETGLSSPGRLHDLFVSCEAITPGEYKEKGKGMQISYGFHQSPFGEVLLAVTERGVCNLKFVKESKADILEWIRDCWPHAELIQSEAKTFPYVNKVFNSGGDATRDPLHLYIKGTNFQIKVWEALLKIPFGQIVSYHSIAKAVNSPGAVRAVGTAIGKNPIPYLIPCHRVIRKMGDFGNYGEGPIRKKALLGWEAAVYQNDLIDESFAAYS